jgi:hypothetical protein
MNARYHGSLTDYHGVIVGYDDCSCPRCCFIDPWHKRHALLVRADRDGQRYLLNHVGRNSYDDLDRLDYFPAYA